MSILIYGDFIDDFLSIWALKTRTKIDDGGGLVV